MKSKRTNTRRGAKLAEAQRKRADIAEARILARFGLTTPAPESPRVRVVEGSGRRWSLNPRSPKGGGVKC